MKVVNNTAERAIALMQLWPRMRSSSSVSYVCLKDTESNIQPAPIRDPEHWIGTLTVKNMGEQITLDTLW